MIPIEFQILCSWSSGLRGGTRIQAAIVKLQPDDANEM
jgi:hypothetical protein